MTGIPIHFLVGTVFRDASPTIGAAVDSVLRQTGDDFRVTLLLVDDSSTDDWRDVLGDRLRRPNVHVRRVVFRGPAARNFVLDEAENAFADVDYVCRLDADDTIADDSVFAALAKIARHYCPDVIVAGNLQMRDGVVLPCPNRAVAELREPDRLLSRVERMATGDTSAELPSCNTVVRRGLSHRYPFVTSAEDHWYTAALLLDPTLRVVIAEELIYSIYRLHGRLTRNNIASDQYFASRRALATYVRERIEGEISNGQS